MFSHNNYVIMSYRHKMPLERDFTHTSKGIFKYLT